MRLFCWARLMIAQGRTALQQAFYAGLVHLQTADLMMEALFHCIVMRPMLLILLLAYNIAKTWLHSLLFHDGWAGRKGSPTTAWQP